MDDPFSMESLRIPTPLGSTPGVGILISVLYFLPTLESLNVSFNTSP